LGKEASGEGKYIFAFFAIRAQRAYVWDDDKHANLQHQKSPAAELESWYLDLKDEGKEFGLPPRFASRRGQTQTRNPRTRLGQFDVRRRPERLMGISMVQTSASG